MIRLTGRVCRIRGEKHVGFVDFEFVDFQKIRKKSHIRLTACAVKQKLFASLQRIFAGVARLAAACFVVI